MFMKRFFILLAMILCIGATDASAADANYVGQYLPQYSGEEAAFMNDLLNQMVNSTNFSDNGDVYNALSNRYGATEASTKYTELLQAARSISPGKEPGTTGSAKFDPCAVPNPKDVREEYEKSCWYCKPFAKLIEAIAAVVVSVFARVKTGSVKLIGIGFALWLAWTAMIYFFKPKGPGEFIKKIGTQTFRVIFAVTLLTVTTTKMLDFVFKPFTVLALEYGSAVQGGVGIAKAGDSILNLVQSNLLPLADETSVEEGSAIGNINKTAMTIFADAVVIWHYSFSTDVGLGCVIPSPEPFLIALLLGAFAIALVITFPLKIVDALFRLGVVIIMTPLLIVAWTFPITQGYAKKGWEMFMGVVIFIMMLAITLSIVTQIIEKSLSEYLSKAGVLVESSDVEGLVNSVSTSSPGFLVLLATFIFCLKIIGSTSDLAKEFSSGIGSGNMGTASAAGTAGVTVAAAYYGTRAIAGAKKYAGMRRAASGDAARGEKKDEGDGGPPAPPPQAPRSNPNP